MEPSADEVSSADEECASSTELTPTPEEANTSCQHSPELLKDSRKRKKQKGKLDCSDAQFVVSSLPDSIIAPPSSMLTRSAPLLICSIGNPGAAYANTLHSAGHTVLNRLATYLQCPPFSKDRAWGNGLVSRSSGDHEWTLWQSTSYMNESGKGVRAAYQTWSRSLVGVGGGKLVVVHDELEKPLGAVSVKTQQGLSARGHNGIKSIMGVMGNVPFIRIGVGIGRPVSREQDDVARYVLRKMDAVEKSKIEASVDVVVERLKALEMG